MAKKSAKIEEIKEMMGETGLIIVEEVNIEPLLVLRKEYVIRNQELITSD